MQPLVTRGWPLPIAIALPIMVALAFSLTPGIGRADDDVIGGFTVPADEEVEIEEVTVNGDILVHGELEIDESTATSGSPKMGSQKSAISGYT